MDTLSGRDLLGERRDAVINVVTPLHNDVTTPRLSSRSNQVKMDVIKRIREGAADRRNIFARHSDAKGIVLLFENILL